MPDWLTDISRSELNPELPILMTRLFMAWACGCLVAWLARRQKQDGVADTLSLTLILMSILIAMATQIIGDNIARAFSLVGALSIVRFRTAVPATRDVAFVLAAVVVGMAVGAGQYAVAVLGLVVVGMATQFNSLTFLRESTDRIAATPAKEPDAETWRVAIQVGLSATSGWEAELQRITSSFQLTSAETVRRGSAMELVYRIIPMPETSCVDLIAILNSIPGVESVTGKKL